MLQCWCVGCNGKEVSRSTYYEHLQKLQCPAAKKQRILEQVRGCPAVPLRSSSCALARLRALAWLTRVSRSVLLTLPCLPFDMCRERRQPQPRQAESCRRAAPRTRQRQRRQRQQQLQQQQPMAAEQQTSSWKATTLQRHLRSRTPVLEATRCRRTVPVAA